MPGIPGMIPDVGSIPEGGRAFDRNDERVNHADRFRLELLVTNEEINQLPNPPGLVPAAAVYPARLELRR